jgi:EAL domain-containing protein (putative c-di-GMP-specific phosphodiesterase class I)
MAFDLLAAHSARLASAADLTGARFAINLSGQSLNDPGLLTFVMDRFAATGIAPQAICFEITETAAIANIVRANRFIAVLKGMGCSFALDDFGSGLSSFSYLKSLPVDFLKIAGNFVQDIEHDALDFAMVEAINDIGHILGLVTVAESVESPAIAAKLRASGIDYGQGLGIEHPRPLEAVLHELGTAKAADKTGGV